MAKNRLRLETDCLNCKHVVEERFCPHCGKEHDSSHYFSTLGNAFFSIFNQCFALKQYGKSGRVQFST